MRTNELKSANYCFYTLLQLLARLGIFDMYKPDEFTSQRATFTDRHL